MFLREVQSRPLEGMMRIAFKKLQDAGHAVPDIMHLFRFKRNGTKHLVRFTEEVMRGPSPLSPGLRELIGTYVSHRNQCGFCCAAHAPVASKWLGAGVVAEVLSNLETSRLDEAHKALLRYVGKLATQAESVTSQDIDELKRHGWTEEAVYDALTVAAMFKFYNTWNNGSGVRNMSSADFAHSGDRLVKMGYCMDFGFLKTLKVIWVGRAELKLSDFWELALAVFGIKRSVTVAPAAAEHASPSSCQIDMALSKSSRV